MAKVIRGFTLVELLVVVTIVALLVSLVLPAVQAAREAGRRTQCANNLKQIGLATLGYEQAHSLLPAGEYRYDKNWNEVGLGSILIRLLPYLEQQPLYDLYDLTRPTDAQVFPGTSKRLASTVLPIYICPSDQPSSPLTASGLGKSNYCASGGPIRVSANPDVPCNLNVTWNVHGVADEGKCVGPFNRFGYNCSLAEIADGMSNTIFFGEQRPACNTGLWNTSWASASSGNGNTFTTVPMNWYSCDHSGTEGCRRYDNWNGAQAFHSLHPGGVLFAFGDGAVRLLPETIDVPTYQHLGNKADGKAVQLNW